LLTFHSQLDWWFAVGIWDGQPSVILEIFELRLPHDWEISKQMMWSSTETKCWEMFEDSRIQNSPTFWLLTYFCLEIEYIKTRVWRY
jgi:hypothetical protein